jgi:hypothetical protein
LQEVALDSFKLLSLEANYSQGTFVAKFRAKPWVGQPRVSFLVLLALTRALKEKSTAIAVRPLNQGAFFLLLSLCTTFKEKEAGMPWLSIK